MSIIRPFRGYRPRAEIVAQVAAPPYDVLSSQEAREIVAGNPLSFLRVTKAEVDLDSSVDIYSQPVYLKAKENLHKFIAEGYLIRDETPCFYIYQQQMGEHVQYGVMAGVSVDEYQNGQIKKHEYTRLEKENDRAHHINTIGANAGPVFLTYRASSRVDAIVDHVREEKAVYDFFEDDGVRHTFWVVDEESSIKGLKKAFAGIECLYIADGHHRSAAASRVREIRKTANPHHTGYEEYNYYLGVIFPHDQMKILDYNRVVKDLNGFTEGEFIAQIAERFDLAEAADPKPEAKNSFGMYLGGKWYRLFAREGTYPKDDPVESLDVSILQSNLLDPLLGIKDERTDARIDFVGGIRGTKELERRCGKDCVVAFTMHPTSIGELMKIADAGKVMPPKSTWFEPKLRSGVVVRMLEE